MTEQLTLFDEVLAAALAMPPRKRRTRRDGRWSLVHHACRHCMGRLLQRQHADGTTEHRCCECGASVQGDHSGLCWCGVEVGVHGKVFECVPNPQRTPAKPQEVLVRERAPKEGGHG